MKRITILFVILITEVVFLAGYLVANVINKPIGKPLINQHKIIEKPLEKYSIENLFNSEMKAGKMIIDSIVSENEKYSSYLFRYSFNPEIIGNITKTTTGIINIPNNTDINGIILTIRGYVDQKIYTSGMGTKNVAQYFADNGFITIAPDFLGYAGSDREADNIFESRFQTYVTVLSLLKTIEEPKMYSQNTTMGNGLTNKFLLTIGQYNHIAISLWGHSNGGQIALTILEIAGNNYPTVLWAPVSKPFPYSVLYYTDESDDRGKLIRSELAVFEDVYDVEKYSLTNFFDRINSPLLIIQGGKDDDVPKSWSDSLVSNLKQHDKNVEYKVFQEADHNMRPNWDEAVKQSLQFYINSKI